MRARAHYLWGSVLRDKDEDVHAVGQYLTAAEYAKQAKDMHLLGRIYSQVGGIYFFHGLYEKADSICLLLEQVATLLNDSSLLLDVTKRKGTIYRAMGRYKDAELLMLKALEVSQKYHNKHSLNDITSSLSLLYSNMKEGEQALCFAKENFALQESKATCFWTFSLLGEAYFHTQQYDSANFYLNKALPTSNYNIKSDIYMRLGDIAKNQGDINLSLIYERLHSSYQDSARMSNQGHAIMNVEKEVGIRGEQKRLGAFVTKYHYLIWGILIVAIITFAILRQRYKKRTTALLKDNVLLSKEQKSLQQECKELQNKLHDTQGQIKTLQNTIDTQNYNANQITKLKEEQQKLKTERNAMLHELFCQTKVYEKMKRIIADYKKLEKSTEKMTDEDWTELIALIDTNWNNLTLRLQADYHLKTNEIRLCCLLMTDLPPSQIHYLLGCSRDNIYKWADRILEQRMGYPHKSTSLREVLKRLC